MIEKLYKILNQGSNVIRYKNARILAYHSIHEDIADPWTVSPQMLSLHLQILYEHNFKIWSHSKLVTALKNGHDVTRVVTLSFDDGFRDFKTNALPILQRYKVPAIVYVPTEKLGKTSNWSSYAPGRPLLSWNDLYEIQNSGVEITIGNHSLTHKHLPLLTDDELSMEIDKSYEELKVRLGITDQHFAYPYGECGLRERNLVEKRGFSSAVTFNGLWGNPPFTDLFLLARSPMLASHSLSHFISIIHGRQDWQQMLQRLQSRFVRPRT